MNFTLRIWRQNGPLDKGKLVPYSVEGIFPDMSFLEMLDVLNEKLIKSDQNVIEFDSDCREGICGTCGLVINGKPHGGFHRTSTCQLHMRHFKDGEEITIEPFRAKAFPVVKDLVVDRSAFDRVLAKGGYISVNTGSAPDANLIPIPKETADEAMDAAECIGCGACVRVCPKETLSMQDEKAVVSGDTSLNCGHCAAACPTGAITVAALAPQLNHFRTFTTDEGWLAYGDSATGKLVRLMRSRRFSTTISRPDFCSCGSPQ